MNLARADSRPALASIVHDPHGKLAELVDKHKGMIPLLFDGGCLAATKETDQFVLSAMAEAGLMVQEGARGPLGIARKLALFGAMSAGRHRRLMYCDLDRLLWWLDTNAQELMRFLERHINQADFIIVGRSEAAWQTHPRRQVWAEQIINRYVGNIYGVPADFLAACRVLSREALTAVLQHSTDSEVSVDVEWPLILKKQCPHLVRDAIPVDGLSYEGSLTMGELEVASMQQWLPGHADRERRYREWCVGRMLWVADQVQAGGEL